MMEVKRTTVESMMTVDVEKTYLKSHRRVVLNIKKDKFSERHPAATVATLKLTAAETRRLIVSLKAQLKRIK